MTKIYACLLGEWVCLNDDPTCVFIDENSEPYIWYEEGAKIWAPLKRTTDMEHSFYNLDYVRINYKGKGYRINPIFLQIVRD